jgi:hypothetical protein
MIDLQLAAFLEDGVGIHLGTRNEQLEPNGARAAAVKVEEGGTHLVVFLAKVAAVRLLPDLHSNGQAAVSFGRPTDERACQVKGTLIDVREAAEEERAFVGAQWEGFLDKLEAIGIPRAASWIWWPAVAVRLKATAVFEQTPGAKAGTQIA